MSSGSTDGQSGTPTETDAQGGTPTDSEAETPTERDPTSAPEDLDTWLEDANGYDGDPRRFGPNSRPSISVGEETDDGMAFAPPVIEIAPGTNVTWEWTGHGGQQNVVALDGTFDSGRTNAQQGTCYEYVFSEPGEHAFVSEPHRDEGMKGAVIVAEPPTTGYDAVDEWMAAASNFDGTVVDRTDRDTTTVTVGAEGNGGAFAFDPPVLRIGTGDTVQWEWTGEGGGHNVVFENHDIDSGEVASEASATFEHTFDDTGQYLYSCLPHQALGMRGAIVVE
ncbi:halocyanin domain-containing protein [Haloarcula onubensis]|uniref:Halocyanin domain-containing protein n=1 Tax=Haloarcula onubensis TaxID=2950539 RepID=A0ABU2FN33_9EURY|nr:halocyanin domain-containing protein [Halomicroarcula sp. S3CR25-11]MDS0281662.1 halocyanin domain-containing protein [Halomicroarcula sp. S3CR25-11]